MANGEGLRKTREREKKPASGVPRMMFNLERVGGIGSRADDVV